MENTLTLFFIICYALAVFVVMRIIRGKFNLTVRRVILVVLIIIPTFDSIASEFVYLAVRQPNTSSHIYNSVVTDGFAIIGNPCAVRLGDTYGVKSFINRSEFDVTIFSSIRLGEPMSDESINKIKKLMFNMGKKKKYIVRTTCRRTFNVVIRNKYIYNIESKNILGKASDVSIVRGVPFFAKILLPSNVSVTTFEGSNLCGFEYKVLLHGKNGENHEGGKG